MYQSFSVVSISTDYSKSQIIVNTNFDVDPDSVDSSTIEVVLKETATAPRVTYSVKGKQIVITLREVVPNKNYILKINSIKTVLGDKLSVGISRKIIFESKINQVPRIISPSDYQELSELEVTLKAFVDNNEVELKDNTTYALQIADDVAFISIKMETKTVDNKIKLQNVGSGQYYIRVRIENIDGTDYSEWSDTVSFIMISSNNDEIASDDEPEFIQEFTVVTAPIDGETPDSIMFELSEEVDSDFLDNIIIIRRDV